jgi:hypothetical protein
MRKRPTKTNGDSRSDETESPEPALLKREQLARAINASPRSVDNWQKQRKIPFIKISPRCVRFHLSSVLAALRKFEVKEAS